MKCRPQHGSPSVNSFVSIIILKVNNQPFHKFQGTEYIGTVSSVKVKPEAQNFQK